MYVTLAEYNRLSPKERRKVMSIDAAIADDFAPLRSRPVEIIENWDYESVGSIKNEEYGQ